MKIIIIGICLILILGFIGCKSLKKIANRDDEKLMVFNPEKHEIILEDAGNREVCNTIDELEELFIKPYPNGVIVECKVIDGSVSRVAPNHNGQLDIDNGRPPFAEYSERYMTTEVEIIKIHYKGLEVPIEEGDKINIHEWYFYATEETP